MPGIKSALLLNKTVKSAAMFYESHAARQTCHDYAYRAK